MFPESRLRPQPTCFHLSTLRLPGPQLTRPSCLFQMVKLYLCTDFCPLEGWPEPTGVVEGHRKWSARGRGWQRAIPQRNKVVTAMFIRGRAIILPADFFPPLSSRMHSKSIGLLSQSKRCYYQEPQCWVEVFIFIFSGTIIAKYVT